MTIATGFFAPSSFIIVGNFPATFFYGVPYDQQLAFSGAYAVPIITDAVVLNALPAGLVIETSVDGIHARLHGTPQESMTLTGVLDLPIKGVAYSSRLQVVGNGGSSNVVVPDISAGTLPPWASLTWHNDTNEIEVSGMPT